MSNPQEAVDAFVHGWLSGDAELMVENAQNSWRMGQNHRAVKKDGYKEADDYMRMRFLISQPIQEYDVGDPRPTDVGIEALDDVMVDVPVHITPKGETTTITRFARVVCEDSLGQPNTHGKWGVNPVSILRRDE